MSTAILVIYTGGTIGMMKDPQSGTLKPFEFKHLYRHIPLLEAFDYRIDIHSFDPLLDSSDMRPEFWVKLASLIEEKYTDYDGFVVLHGSDTMAYSASVLSFMLENLGKPVVFTGSQLPMGVVRNDGRENFINAVEIAAANNQGEPMVPEVTICFENKLYRGNRTSKINAEHFDAFISGNYPVLADIGVNIRYYPELILHPQQEKLKVHKKLGSELGILKLWPGITPMAVEAALHAAGFKALILETFGSGNAPSATWFIKALKQAIESGLIILNVTQCKGGKVEMGRYETSVQLEEIGVVSGHDITTEAALAKLMFLLGMDTGRDEVCKLLHKNLRGEMTT